MPAAQRFHDRRDAGRQLGEKLAQRDLADAIVLGLPRGGVPVAAEVAQRLRVPLDVVVVRKVGAPTNPEYALGAIGEGGVEVLDQQALRTVGVRRDDLTATIRREREELARRVHRYRGERQGLDVAGRVTVIVDDGIATGSTARAAGQVLRAAGAVRVILAVPVGPPRSIERLAGDFDEVVVLSTPPDFRAVGSWYDSFAQTTDDEVERLLSQAHAADAAE